jgi:predicted nuclease of predicted toxin-antitoxin system
VKFLVDAQLHARLAGFLQHAGHDAVHTSELPTGNRTTDTRITQIADGESRVVVTKDRDFRDGHLLSGSPRRLLVVATGNITNTELLALFQDYLTTIVDAFGEADFVELGPHTLVIHQRRDPGPPS